VQQAIRGAPVERGVLDVLAEHTGAFLVATSEQAAALVMLMRRTGSFIVLFRHGVSPYETTCPR
jgi:hypothetical protein